MRRWAAVTSVLTGASRRADLRTSARRLLDELGIGLSTNSERLSVPGETGTLVVANHVSWLDIVAAIAVEPTAFLAKHEVRTWPLIGSLAARCGTVFVDRREMRRLPEAVAGIAATLRAGRSVVVFPEGTTWCGRCGPGEFRRAAFQAAIDAGAPIRPVTLEYRQDGEPSTAAAFVGDETLATSLNRISRADGLEVRLTAHPALDPDGDRRELAARAELSVRQAAYV
ncbi:1-acyl-sn-glycerol-3-phosphate acyltransferase [Amycolatopsis sp. K13G38]|uniref:1-acyl-sn-glycerol-3-phosphate acyltransferase n=1 Tax=Amycolatopsis acididurans TaxID=2724524 RepID=A0ABX1J9B7_9PSEU|nr:lysophospholipid acyltransferase family protein [Amycolatopsis acididurans]NKQ55085.1 1-acyl-sn-glycerol-3-phosphate acyltransferase [Amycolatopsis acididurans]